ncbi:hypothetical protein Btru_034069 [Bulinus truncatus]|nr:hypothetical protein Btru_034069 [Bulinus truncatus]
MDDGILPRWYQKWELSPCGVGELIRYINSEIIDKFTSGILKAPDMNEASEVVPLDITQLRKTQRRVAALLQSVRTSAEYCPLRKSTLTAGYELCSRLNPQQEENTWSFYTRPPNPSAASVVTRGNNNDDEDYSDIRGLIKSFRPSIQRDYLPDRGSRRRYPQPPLYDDIGGVKSHGKDKTGSEINDGTLPPLKIPGNNFHKITDDANLNSDVGIDRLRFPEIDNLSSLVSARVNETHQEIIERNRGSYSERKLSPIKDSALERNFSFVSERTEGSLRINEDYIPMTITITKLSEADIRERTNEMSDTSNGRLDWTTDDFKHRSEESSSTGRGDSPVDFQSRLRSASWCSCSRSGPGAAPCTECRKVGGHEKWCVSASGLCQFCRKPIKKLNSRHRKENTTGVESLNSIESDDPDNSNFSGKRKSLSHAERRKQREAREKYEQDLNTASSPRLQENQRVRFEDESRPPETTSSQAVHVGGANSAAFTEDVAVNRKKKRKKKNGVADQPDDQRRPQDDQVISIPKIGVNVHRTAYILALRDSMERTASRKPRAKDKKRDRGEAADNSSKGTIFSYFTLLKRPLSDPSHRLNLGIKPDLGAVPKDGMKHVFGNIKFSDYYPGGKRWREIDED